MCRLAGESDTYAVNTRIDRDKERSTHEIDYGGDFGRLVAESKTLTYWLF